LSLADIKLVTLAYQDINISFANKSVDASVQIEPFVAAAVENKLAVRVAGDDEVYPNQQSAAIFYSPVFIEKHLKEAQGFMNAYVRGLRDYNDAFEKGIGRDGIIAILAKHTKADPKVFQSVAPVGLHPDGMVNVQSLRDDALWYRKHGYLEQAPNIDAIVDMSYARRAAAKLGPYK